MDKVNVGFETRVAVKNTNDGSPVCDLAVTANYFGLDAAQLTMMEDSYNKTVVPAMASHTQNLIDASKEAIIAGQDKAEPASQAIDKVARRG